MSEALTATVTIAFHGVAFAMVLYLISVGLSVTMGLMGFVNLAHGVFAAAGGYVMTTLFNNYGVPFPAAVAIAAVAVGAASIVLERGLYRRLYGGDELDQVLMTIALIFMSIAAAKYLWGSEQQPMIPPPYLAGHVAIAGREFPTYRVFIIAAGAVLVTLLWLGLDRTRLGAKIRAAVDNRRMAQSVGINTSGLFSFTFALGTGLAALGGALGAELLPIFPSYSLENLIYFLIVVAVGGLGTIRGPFFAALLLGISDTAFKYLLPEFGSFFIYALTLVVLLIRPKGLFGQIGRAWSAPPIPSLAESALPPAALPNAVRRLMRRHRPRPYEALPWLLAIGAYFVFPDYLSLGAQIFIAILFALATDLILGYGGVITLGQAAFFGTGAYACGILSAHGWTEPLGLLVVAALAAALVGFLSGFVVLRTTGLTQLMLTLIVAVMLEAAADQATTVTGGANGLQGMVIAPVLGRFDFDLYGVTAYFYCLAVLFLAWLLVRTLVHAPFGRSLTGIRESEARMHAIGSPVFRRRLTAYCISAALCGVAGALLAETTQLVALDSLSFERSGAVLIMLIVGGVGRLYGAFIGVPLYMIAQDRFAQADPVYWYFWIGLFLLLVVLFARGGIIGLGERLTHRFRR